MRSLNNRVWIEIPSFMDGEVKMGEVVLKMDTSFDPEQYVTTTGIVRVVPDKIKIDSYIDHECDMDVRENDRVTMSYAGVMEAKHFRESIERNGKMLVAVHYMYLIERIRDGIGEMLNGYCKCIPVKKEHINKSQTSLQLPDTKINELSKNVVKIVKLGKPNKKYNNNIQTDDINVSVNDLVLCHKSALIQYYESTDKLVRKEFAYKIQRRHMMAKIEIV